MQDYLDREKLLRAIEKERKKQGLSYYELAKRAGVSSSTLYKWRKNLSSPSMPLIESLCYALGTSYSLLLDESSPRIASPLNESETKLIDFFRKTDDSGKEELLKRLAAMAEKQNKD